MKETTEYTKFILMGKWEEPLGVGIEFKDQINITLLLITWETNSKLKLSISKLYEAMSHFDIFLYRAYNFLILIGNISR